jgi:hypothetical protein
MPVFLIAALAVVVSVGWAHHAATPDLEGRSTPVAPVASAGTVQPGEPFVLALGETVVLPDGLAVRFAAVIGDSRCPADVVCVWEGDAEIELDVAMAGEQPALVRLHTNASFGTEVAYLGSLIGLIGLDPEPRTDSETDEPYRATLVATSTSVTGTPPPGQMRPAGWPVARGRMAPSGRADRH